MAAPPSSRPGGGQLAGGRGGLRRPEVLRGPRHLRGDGRQYRLRPPPFVQCVRGYRHHFSGSLNAFRSAIEAVCRDTCVLKTAAVVFRPRRGAGAVQGAVRGRRRGGDGGESAIFSRAIQGVCCTMRLEPAVQVLDSLNGKLENANLCRKKIR